MKKAFTLIEVMVVLSILAIIAILAYNFFGSTMKEATVKKAAAELTKQALLYESGWMEYVRKNGQEPDTSSTAASDALKAQLLSDGIFRSMPTPDPSWRISTCATEVSPGGATGWKYLSVGSYGGTAENDVYVLLGCINDDICAEFNNMHNNGLDFTVNTMHVVDDNGGMGCVLGTAADSNRLVNFIDIR